MDDDILKLTCQTQDEMADTRDRLHQVAVSPAGMMARVAVHREEEGSNDDAGSQPLPVKDTNESPMDWTAVNIEVRMVRAGKEFKQKTGTCFMCSNHGHYSWDCLKKEDFQKYLNTLWGPQKGG